MGGDLIVDSIVEIEAYSMPEIIFSYSSHHGTWSSFFAFSISAASFIVAAIMGDIAV